MLKKTVCEMLYGRYFKGKDIKIYILNLHDYPSRYRSLYGYKVDQEILESIINYETKSDINS